MVEDEESLRVPVCKLLRRNGLSVLEAEDGIAAVGLFRDRQSEIGVVLLDWTLPGLSGQQVYLELQRIQPGVKVIVTTAYSQETAMSSIAGQPPWAFLRKPYQLADLVQLLRKALAA